jgi:hypothetical protein
VDHSAGKNENPFTAMLFSDVNEIIIVNINGMKHINPNPPMIR